MTYLETISKWIQLSCRKHFVSRVQNAPVYFEEMPKKTNNTQGYQLGVEFRLDGPINRHIGTKREWESTIELNALVTAAFDEKDPMSLTKLTGVVVEAMSHDFCVYRLGTNSTYDTLAYFGTLKLITEDDIEQANFGQIDATNKVYQTSIEAHYRIRWTNGTI